MKTLSRIIPVSLLTALIILISVFLYGEMIYHEEEECWKELSSTANYLKEEIDAKFQDEIVKLRLVADIMIQDDVFQTKNTASLHMDTVQPTTIFSRVDLLFPDQTYVSNGVVTTIDEKISFDDIASKGEYMSTRKTDFQTGRECVYYVLPVMKENQVQAVLIGVIDANSLSTWFNPSIYNGKANICLINATDGNYIMDSWHEQLGNAYTEESRETLKGYDDVNLQTELRNLNTGSVAFISQSTGKTIYMYYTPISSLGWQLSIFAPEDALFENLIHMRHKFILAGTVDVLLLLMYFLWNLRTIKQLERINAENEKQKEQLQFISYRDMITSLYNRTKYNEVLDTLENKTIQHIGIAYIDLNGLKQINDTQSHTAGDNYIRNAGKVISSIFCDQSYRIGGDEFVILSMDTEESVFLGKIETLQSQMKQQNISISLGALWQEQCLHLEASLIEAEKAMYAEKESYYRTHDRRNRS